MTAPAFRIGGVRVTTSAVQLRGHHALTRNGQVVWQGPIGSPIEDVVFDGLIMHPEDLGLLTPQGADRAGERS